MNDKLKKISEYMSFYTTNPDSDWKRLFTYMSIAVGLILCWSLYFYIIVKKDIHESETLKVPRSAGIVLESENSLKNVITVMEEKRLQNSAILNNATTSYISSNPN